MSKERLNNAINQLIKEIPQSDERSIEMIRNLACHIENSGDPDLFRDLADFFDLYCTDRTAMEKLGILFLAGGDQAYEKMCNIN